MKTDHLKYICILLAALFLLSPSVASATEDYAGRTGQDCLACHIEEGGPLTAAGLDFAASGYTWPPKRGQRALLRLPKSVMTITGFLHILAAFAWFGTILYVHLILKPAYASSGLPRGEVLLGLYSMAVVAITGIILTLSKVSGMDVLTDTMWGRVLILKVLLFAVMVLLALIAVFVIGPKLKKRIAAKGAPPADGIFGPHTLSGFDGRDGNLAFFAYEKKVYDVSGSGKWPHGTHFKRHFAGIDLSGALSGAPHGAEKFEAVKEIGTYDPELPVPEDTPKKHFYLLAYVNLILVFVILFVIAYWNWGI